MIAPSGDEVLHNLADLVRAFGEVDLDGLEANLQNTELVYEASYKGEEIDVWIDGGDTLEDIAVVVGYRGFHPKYPTTYGEFWADFEDSVKSAHAMMRQECLVTFDADIASILDQVDATQHIAEFLDRSEAYVARKLGRGWKPLDPIALNSLLDSIGYELVDRWYCQFGPTPVFLGFGHANAFVRPSKLINGSVVPDQKSREEVPLWSPHTLPGLRKALDAVRLGIDHNA